jgi:hypothetical protein
LFPLGKGSKKALFFEKKKQKTFVSWRLWAGRRSGVTVGKAWMPAFAGMTGGIGLRASPNPQCAKVFWFFFSKKNFLLTCRG